MQFYNSVSSTEHQHFGEIPYLYNVGNIPEMLMSFLKSAHLVVLLYGYNCFNEMITFVTCGLWKRPLTLKNAH